MQLRCNTFIHDSQVPNRVLTNGIAKNEGSRPNGLSQLLTDIGPGSFPLIGCSDVLDDIDGWREKLAVGIDPDWWIMDEPNKDSRSFL